MSSVLMKVAKGEEAALNPDVFSASWRLKLVPSASPSEACVLHKIQTCALDSADRVSCTLLYNYTSPRSISMKKFRQHVRPAVFNGKQPGGEMLVAA